MQQKNENLPLALILVTLVVLLIAVVGFKFLNNSLVRDKWPDLTQSSPIKTPLSAPKGMTVIRGVVFTGAQIQGDDAYCAEGLYIRVDEAIVPEDMNSITSGSMIALRTKGGGTAQFPEALKPYSDTSVVNATVTVVGVYPAREVQCKALMCDCDDAIIVDNLTVEVPANLDAEIVQLTGEIVCLPKKGSGPQTMECLFGLQTPDDKRYFLTNLGERLGGSQGDGSTLKVKAVFSKADPNTPYDVDGSLDVISIEKL